MRILAVEDDPLVGRLLTRMLRSLGHATTLALDAAAALDHLSTMEFDLLITDHGLPDQSGAELAEAVRASWPTLPIILVSGWGAEVPPGLVDAKLDKPYTHEQLQAALAAAWPPGSQAAE